MSPATPTRAPAVDVDLLAREHGARVIAFAQAMLGSRADAEDAAQEAFLRAHREAATFRGDCAASTWVLAIARNVCLDRVRDRARRSFTTLDDVVAQGAREAARDDRLHAAADDAAARRQYVAAVREGCLLGTLACLTPDQRAAFVLRTLADLATHEVATVLGRSPGAVRVLLHRARTRLKGFLCRHCSLWDPGNACDCENLVAFSLVRGWITSDDARPAPAEAGVAEAAAGAVDDVARLAALYRSAIGADGRTEAAERLRGALARLEALAR